MPGTDGRDGRDGRDAAELEILPTISASRSYARGTYASHFGGLWRSARVTDEIAEDATPEDVQKAGWSCIVEGRAAVYMEQRGEREFVLRDVSSTGRASELTFKVNFQIYRKAFQEGREYEIGDVVTFGGCQWHCNVDGTKSKPGTIGSTDWTLCVKKGHDGKDGADGKDGEPGKDGRNWNEKA